MDPSKIKDHPPERLTRRIQDAEIPYLLYNGPGKTLILLHGTGFPPELWHPLARKLSQYFRIIAPAYCDHRETPPAEGAIPWSLLAGDLKDFCDKLQLEKPLVVGHSMGGTVAAIAEVECGLRAGGLILIEPIFLMEELYQIVFQVQDHPLASKSIKRTYYWPNEQELRNYLQSKPLFKQWAEEMVERYIQYGFGGNPGGGLQLLCSPSKEAALLMGGMKNNPWPMFPRIACPVLVLEGETSENRLYTKLEKAASLIPRGSYALIEKAGHLIPMEKPEEVNSIIIKFFREVNY